jgi:outer membrane protein assembly factor BamB
MAYRLFPVVIAVWLGVTASSDAAKVKVWNPRTQASFDKAKFAKAVVSSEGVVSLSRILKPLANPGAANIWALAETKDGILYAASGDEGKIFRVEGDVCKEVYAGKDSQVLALAAADDGSVYAGTGPGGRILRLTPKGAEVVAEGLDTYIWALVYDPEENALYAGTGPKGKIYKIDAKGRSSVFYATKQEHVLCLAMGPKGTLYAGTDKGGLVYRITPDGKGFVVFHAHQTEVRSLLLADGTIYAGTSAPVSRKSSSFSLPKPGLDDVRPFGTASGENSLYRVASDGTAREVYRDKTMILSLLRQGDHLLVGTGMQGQLQSVNAATKERSEIARLDAGTIHCLLQRKNGAIVLGTGDPGKLYLLENDYAGKGTVLSEVLDAKMPARWGAMTWKAVGAHTWLAPEPAGGPPAPKIVSVAVRAGNVAEPDDTWSAWSAEQVDPTSAKANAPVARYFQYRVTLSSAAPQVTPTFSDFTLRYQTVNQSPEIASLDVPDLDTTNLENPKKLKLKWSASDPNDDELIYALWFKKDGWKEWVLLEDNLEKNNFDWDTTGVPSGMYQIKVVASDRKENTAEECLAAERISAPVPVAHVPPTVNLKLVRVEGDRALLEATATDPLVRLTEASFAVNGKKWTNVFPTDGLFDSKTENFRFQTEALRPGTYVVVLRVRDAAGNVGSGDVVFNVK